MQGAGYQWLAGQQNEGLLGKTGCWGVPAWGGGSEGGAALEAACGVGTSSMGRLAGRAAAGVGSGWGVVAPWESGWQAAIASQS